MTESVLRNAAEDGGPMVVLLRMVRERDGNIDALVTDFERRARERPSELSPRLALGHLYREAGRVDEALREYQAAERISPQNAAPARAMADLYHRMDRAADERAARERVLARSTDRRTQSEALRQLIELSLVANDLPAARRYHTRLLALDPNSLTVRRELADALLQRRLFDDAVTEFESLVRALSGDNRVLPPVLRDLGRAHAGAGHHDRAIESYRRALRIAGADAGVRRELYDAMTESFVAQNQLSPWIAELERMTGGSDTFQRAMLLGRLHDQAGDAPAAIRAYQRAVAARRTDVDAQRALAQVYRRVGMREEEIAAYRQLVRLAPRETDWVIELADLLVNSGHRDEAVRMLAECSRRAGSDSAVHERLAEVYARYAMRAESLRETELVARLDPSSPVALAALGRQYMEADQRDRALATWRRILDTSRDRGRGALALGNVYFDNGMLAEAAEMFREATERRPDDVDARLRYAEVLERLRQFDPAIVQWREVLARARTDRGIRRAARQSVVRLWQLEGRLSAEIVRLQERVQREPTDTESARDLAEALQHLHRWSDAEPVLQHIVRTEPGDSVSLEALERVQVQRGDFEGAIATLQRLCEAEPRRARDFYQRMAQHALALHREADAMTYASRAVQLNDQDATAHLRLAGMYRAAGNVDAAIASLRRAIELNDRLFPTYFELAELYLGHRGAAPEAVALYRRVIQLSTDDEYVLRAGRRAVQIAPAAGVGDLLERDLAQASANQPTRGVFRRLLVSYFDAAARPLINRVREGSTEQAREARAALARMGARALAPLLDALSDTDSSQQQIALDILGYLANPNAASALLALAENDQARATLRQSALLAAAALGDPRSLTRLSTLARDSGDGALASIATWGIAHIATRPAQETLLRMLSAPRAATQVMAIVGLSRAPDARTRAALQRLVEASTTPEMHRAAALFALGSQVAPSYRASLITSLDASIPELRAAGAYAIATAPVAQHHESAVALTRLLFLPDAGSLSVRRAAARALGQLAGDRALDEERARTLEDTTLARSGDLMLRALLDPPGRTVVASAALTRFEREIIESAREALGGLQERVMAVLLALRAPDALDPLVSADDVRATPALQASLQRVRVALVEEIAAHATHPQVEVRQAAVTVLTQSGAGALAALVRACLDEDEQVASRAMDAVATLAPTPETVVALTSRLAPTTHWLVRTRAASALGHFAGNAARDALVQTLTQDAFAYVRVAAVRALARPEHLAQSRAALTQASREDTDTAVREAAQAALTP